MLPARHEGDLRDRGRGGDGGGQRLREEGPRTDLRLPATALRREPEEWLRRDGLHGAVEAVRQARE